MENLCPHNSKKDYYCKECHGDIIVPLSKKKVIGILLDLSSSMRGRKIDSAKQAIENVLNKIPTDMDINVVLTIFSSDLEDNYTDIIPYGLKFDSKIRDIAIKKLKKLQSGGGTPLYQAIDKFMDDTWSKGALDKNKIFFPFTYLIILSDGEENKSKLDIIYKGKKDKEGFFSKLEEYRNVGLLTEIIPYAYGEVKERDIQLIQDLKSISGKILINEIDPNIIIDTLTNRVDSIINEEIANLEIPLDTPKEIISKLVKTKKDEKELLKDPDILKDRLFLKNLLNNLEEMKNL